MLNLPCTHADWWPRVWDRIALGTWRHDPWAACSPCLENSWARGIHAPTPQLLCRLAIRTTINLCVWAAHIRPRDLLAIDPWFRDTNPNLVVGALGSDYSEPRKLSPRSFCTGSNSIPRCLGTTGPAFASIDYQCSDNRATIAVARSHRIVGIYFLLLVPKIKFYPIKISFFFS